MSLFNYQRNPCPRCQSSVFTTSFIEDDALGTVQYTRCADCGCNWPEYTPEQLRIMDGIEARIREESDREFVERELMLSLRTSAHPYKVSMDGKTLWGFWNPVDALRFIQNNTFHLRQSGTVWQLIHDGEVVKSGTY